MNNENYHILTSDGELYHHGIKGQKWGVRRFQSKDGSLTNAGKKRYSNKEIRQDRDAIRTELASHGGSNLTGDAKKAYYENQKIEKRILHLLDKYEFDQDDGGGGKTDADRKAGQEYMELSEKYHYNDDIISIERNKQVTQKLVEKYGQKRIDQLKTADNVKTGVAVVTVLAAAPVMVTAGGFVVAGAAVAAGGYLGYKAIKNKIKKRKESKNNKKSKKNATDTTGRRVILDMVDERTGKKTRTINALESKYTEAELTKLEEEAFKNGNYRTIDVSNFRRK